MNNIFVLYHKDCQDGIAAAWVAWKHFKDKAGYLAVQYGEPFPNIPINNETIIYILDFSYDRQTLLDIATRIKSLYVIDHHKTAQEELRGLSFANFDMSKSGAMLTWLHFFPNLVIHDLIFYVQDRDLWEWQLRKSREVSAALASFPKTIEQFDKLISDYNIEALIQKGEVLLENQKQIVEALAFRAEINTTIFEPEAIPIINSSTLQSELGEQLLKNFPEAPFAAIYFHPTYNEIVWSLRSRAGSDVDVSLIAKTRGGGGHKNAAGFKITL